jgi:hypothetical protein
MQTILAWIGPHQTAPPQIVERKATENLEPPPDYWERACLELELLPHQLQQQQNGQSLMLQIIVMGKDQRFWQGLYGSKVTNISVRILGSPEELNDILLQPRLRDQQQQRQLQGLPRMARIFNRNNNDENQNNIMPRMVWDFCFPALFFIILAWWAQQD